jgi:pimeloyl-[acyl-carrier protein] synthase
MNDLEFDTYSPQWLADPYGYYRVLRAADPVHWSERLGHWVLTRYRDIVSVLKDPRFSARDRPPQRRWGRPTMMVTADPPDHARLRRPATHRFTAGSVDALGPRIDAFVQERLDAAAEKGEIEVVSELARPLPLTIISELMGVPVDGSRLRGAAAESMNAPGAMSRPEAMAAVGRRARRTAETDTNAETPLDRFFREAFDRHRAELNDDLLQDILRAEAGGRMTAEEVLDTAVILYGAGQETTAKMIGNGVYELLRHPDQLRLLQEEPSLIGAATEELFRFNPPVHAISRRASRDVELAGKEIKAGQRVLCFLAAANRDPETFPGPDALDIRREENYHITFGMGVHTCLGGLLARAETAAAIGALVQRFPRLRLAEPEVEWEGSFIIRGVRRLPVLLD